MTNILIRGATLIVGNGQAPIADSGVLITDDRVAAAGPLEQVLQHAEASGAQVIDAVKH